MWGWVRQQGGPQRLGLKHSPIRLSETIWAQSPGLEQEYSGHQQTQLFLASLWGKWVCGLSACL